MTAAGHARPIKWGAATGVDRVEVVAPNFKRRLSGITATLERVLPIQARTVVARALGPGLSDNVPRMAIASLPDLWPKPASRPFRIWHARRNTEMLGGVVLRDILRTPLALVFTSASRRHHTAWSRFLIGRMEAVIATSAATADYLTRSSTVIPHGIAIDQFHPGESPAAARAALGLPEFTAVGCFGRIRQQKGTDVFVDAMIDLIPGRPGVGAVVLGRATRRHLGFLDELRQRVAKAGLTDRILFPGEVSPSQTAAWYRALDIFVAPQRWEGFGVTPLEAMATGLPVVATSVGAMPELVIDGATGLLVPPGDVAAMAEAVRQLLTDSEMRTRFGREGRQRVKQVFTIVREAEAINAVYEALWTHASTACDQRPPDGKSI